jgi:hypothetical protein
LDQNAFAYCLKTVTLLHIMTEEPNQYKPPYVVGADSISISQQYKTDDIFALSLLKPLLTDYPYLPFTGSALRPFCLAHMLNVIVINGRRTIIEFGSEISTILIARLIKKNKLNPTLLSIKNGLNWVKTLTGILQTEQMDDVVNVQCAPLKSSKRALDNSKWCDFKILKALVKRRKFDRVIIVGPAAWEPGRGNSRYPAVPFIANKLDGSFSIYLDDAVRHDERAVIKMWEEYAIHFNKASRSLAYYYKGVSFNTEPFNYCLF